MLRVSLRDRQVSAHVLHGRALRPSRTVCPCQTFHVLRLFDYSFCRAASFRLTVLQRANSLLTFENNKFTGTGDILEKYAVSLSLSHTFSLEKRRKRGKKEREKREKERERGKKEEEKKKKEKRKKKKEKKKNQAWDAN